MKFGLFTSAQANSRELGPEAGQGFRDWLDFNVEAEALGFKSSFLVEHHFTGWNQVSSTLMLLMALAMRTKTLRLGSAVMVLPWHNPVLLRGAGGDARSRLRRPLRFRHRQGLSAQRVQGLSNRAGRGRGAFRGGGRGDDARVYDARALLAPRPLLAFRGHRRRAAAGAKAASAVLAGRRQRASIRRAAARGFNLILDQYAGPQQIAERIGIYKAERTASRPAFRSHAGRGRAAALCRQERSR